MSPIHKNLESIGELISIRATIVNFGEKLRLHQSHVRHRKWQRDAIKHRRAAVQRKKIFNYMMKLLPVRSIE